MKILKAIENFRTIIETAKSVKDKRLSEMTLVEQHAVQFCSWIRFAREHHKHPGKLMYTKAEDKDLYVCGSALCPAVTEIKKIYNFLQVTKYADAITLFSVNSYAIMIDKEPARFKEASVTSCLEEYPDQLFLPAFSMTDITDGLPPIVLDEIEPQQEESIDSFQTELSRLLVYWTNPTKSLTKPQKYATYLILKYTDMSDHFIDTVRKFMPYFPRNFREYVNVRTLSDVPKATIRLEDVQKLPFKSLECSAVFLALKGLYIKFRE